MGESLPTQGSVLSTAPTIQNIEVASADTEVPVSIPPKTSRIYIKARGRTTIQLSFIVDESNTTFITIPFGCAYSETELDLSGASLYLRTDQPLQVVEVLSWSHP